MQLLLLHLGARTPACFAAALAQIWGFTDLGGVTDLGGDHRS